MRERKAFKICLVETTSDAVRELHAPLVTAMYHERKTDEQVASAD